MPRSADPVEQVTRADHEKPRGDALLGTFPRAHPVQFGVYISFIALGLSTALDDVRRALSRGDLAELAELVVVLVIGTLAGALAGRMMGR